MHANPNSYNYGYPAAYSTAHPGHHHHHHHHNHHNGIHQHSFPSSHHNNGFGSSDPATTPMNSNAFNGNNTLIRDFAFHKSPKLTCCNFEENYNQENAANLESMYPTATTSNGTTTNFNQTAAVTAAAVAAAAVASNSTSLYLSSSSSSSKSSNNSDASSTSISPQSSTTNNSPYLAPSTTNSKLDFPYFVPLFSNFDFNFLKIF